MTRHRPRRRLAWLAVPMVAGWLIAGADEGATAEPRASREVLANGMTVVVIPDHRAPIVTHALVYFAGAADEAPGVSGIAHFLEHLMFKGTRRNPSGVFARAISRLGGRDNAVTSHDATIYYQRLPKDALSAAMQLEADRMTGLVLAESDVASERDVIIAERRQRIDLSPLDLLNVEMSAALHPGHPYRIPVLGWAHEMSRLTRADALDFYQRHYRPENAAVVIVGDIEPSRAVELANSIYGALPARGVAPERRRPLDPEPRAARRVELLDSRVSNTSVTRLYAVPSQASAAGRDAEALEVLARILTEGDGSRIARRLVTERNLAIRTDGGYSATGRDGGELAVQALVAPGIDPMLIEAAIDAEIAALAEQGVSDDEVLRAKAVIEARDVFRRDDQLSLALLHAQALAAGLGPEHIATKHERLALVTPADVQRLARSMLRPERSVTGLLRPSAPAGKRDNGAE